MAQMTRKQIYIQKHQLASLKRLAQLRGVSEAEVIRRALDRELTGGYTQINLDAQAWEQAYQYMQSLHKLGPLAGHTRDWKREDLYVERMKRYG